MDAWSHLSLEGRTAVVTGAGRGIGSAIAARLASSGAHVVLVGRAQHRLEPQARRIREAGGSADVLVGDVRTSAWFTELTDLVPTVDVLVNNAAAYAPFEVIEDGSDAHFAMVHATIVDGPRRLIQHVLPQMKARGFGRLVSIGSLASELGGAGQAAYVSAKGALIGLTRTVAVEASRFGVTANIVQPGLIDTERIAEAVDPEVRDRILRGVPAGRMGTADEVAHVVAFLASPACGYVTGAVVPVAGGLGLGLFSRGAA